MQDMQNIRDAMKGKRITVIGAGISGASLAQLGARMGAAVFVSDARKIEPACTLDRFRSMNIRWEETGHTEKALDADCVVLSSGISPACFPVTEAKKRGIPVMGELDFIAPCLHGRIVGVTGSNGKSTTTCLIGHMLQRMGFSVAVTGNIGNPLGDAAFQPWDFIVAELSSFQLFWNHDLHCDVAIVTNLAPDHIDWHGSYEGYVESKGRILHTRRPDGWGIVQGRDIPALFRDLPVSRTLPLRWKDEGISGLPALFVDGEKECVTMARNDGEEPLFSFESLPLIGNHNVENGAMAAAAIRLLGIVPENMGSLFEGFKGLPHRCEFVACVRGVKYIDDSKGTNVASSATALSSIQGPKVVILGGQGKGEDYAPLADAVRRNATAAVVLGQEKEKIVSALRAAGFQGIWEASSMEEAVLTASRIVPENGTVLLSPACTSWDMYPNYKKRGEHFRKIVTGLER